MIKMTKTIYQLHKIKKVKEINLQYKKVIMLKMKMENSKYKLTQINKISKYNFNFFYYFIQKK